MRRDGFSYQEITAVTGLVKSTLAYMLKNVAVSEEAKERLRQWKIDNRKRVYVPMTEEHKMLLSEANKKWRAEHPSPPKVTSKKIPKEPKPRQTVFEEKVYGPYTRKEDGRQHVIKQHTDGSQHTVSYPKYLVEQALGRELDPVAETVDHIDGNFHNNNFTNLRLIPLGKHVSEDNRRVTTSEITCIWCGVVVTAKIKDRVHSMKQGSAGPFCSRVCSGEYGSKVQSGEQEPLGYTMIDDREYFCKEKIDFVTVADLIAQQKSLIWPADRNW